MTTRPASFRRVASPKGSAPPKYAQLREELRKQIETLKADQPIPSEYELCDKYGVSRITVRKAVNDLVHEGLLYSQQGKGTFVAPRKFRIEWARRCCSFTTPCTMLLIGRWSTASSSGEAIARRWRSPW